MEYCGHTVNFKTHRQSYKIKKTIENPPDQWKIFRNTHEAIVDEETSDRVQELRRNKRRPAKTGKSNLFSGVAYCADCGEKLYYCTTQNFEERQDHFVCSTSRKKGKDVCGTHFIRAMVLEKGVLKAELTEKMQLWEQEITKQEEEADSIEQFIRRAKKYPELTELTPAVLHDLVNKVYVCAPDKSSGHRVQDVRISLACIGFLPESIITEMVNHAVKSRTA